MTEQRSSTVNDVELYALRDLIASHIACEEDCMALPTGCGCALTAARAVLNRHSQGSQGCGDPSCKDPNCTYGKGENRLAQASRMEELEKFVVSVREIISECGEDFHVCAVCGQQDDDATKDSDLLLLLKASLEATTTSLPSTPSGTEPSAPAPPPDWKQDQAETSRLPRKPEARYIQRDREFIERGLSEASRSANPALAADARRALGAFRSSTMRSALEQIRDAEQPEAGLIAGVDIWQAAFEELQRRAAEALASHDGSPPTQNGKTG